jgi:hypothetical protein
MNNSALFILNDNVTTNVASRGYANALRAVGWKVFAYQPVCKADIVSIIEQLDVSIIFVSCVCGLRNLPIDLINKRSICVIIEALPFNNDGFCLDNRFGCATYDDVSVAGMINRKIVHTSAEPHVWGKYFHRWFDQDIPLMQLPMAGDSLISTPQDLSPTHGVSIIANMSHRMDILREWILPLLMRISGRLNTVIHGDNTWNTIGINGVVPFTGNPANIYSRSNVCVNLHTTDQAKEGAVLNGRTFASAICGGLPIINTSLGAKYFGNMIPVVSDVTAFIQFVEAIGSRPEVRLGIIKSLVTHTATQHSYFNRLVDIFNVLGQKSIVDEINRIGLQAATKHLWKVESLLERKE